MSSDLVPAPFAPPVSLVPSEADREVLASKSDDSFLPSLKLIHGVSPEIEQGAVVGQYWISNVNRVAGSKVIITVLGRRAHALLMKDNRKAAESFNAQSPLFKEIMHTVEVGQVVRASYTLTDYLIYLPEHDVFVTLFPGRKTTRPVGFEILDHMTPVDQRKPGPMQDLIYTCVFELAVKVKSFGQDKRAYIPIIKPLEPNKEFFPSQAPFDAAQELFYAPVKAEVQVELAPQGTVGR